MRRLLALCALLLALLAAPGTADLDCGNLTPSECYAEESVSRSDNGEGRLPQCPDPLNGWCAGDRISPDHPSERED